MEAPLRPGEVPVSFVMCLAGGAAAQYLTPLNSALLGVATTCAVMGLITLWRIWRGQGLWPSVIRGLVFTVGWCAGMTIVRLLS